MAVEETADKNPAPRRRYVRAVGPRLRIVLLLVFGLVALLAANSLYLSAITFLEWIKSEPNQTYQNWFYMVMFGTHLALGFLLILPLVLSEFFTPKLLSTAEPARSQDRLRSFRRQSPGSDQRPVADTNRRFPVQEPWA